MSAGASLKASSTAALEALPFPVCVYDPALVLVFANAAALGEIGGPRGVAPGARLGEVVRLLAYRGLLGHGDPEALATAHLALDRSRPLRRLLRQPDGRVQDFRTLPLEDGGFCAIALDVTEHTHATEQALARAQMLETVLTHLDGGVALFDQTQRLLVSNPSYEALVGLAPGTVRPGMSRAEVLHLLAARGEFANAGDEAAVAAALARDPGAPFGYQRTRPNGAVLQLESKPAGRAGQLIELTDITPLKRAEDEARRRAALLDGVLAAIPHGVLVFGPDQRVTMANAGYQAIMADSPVVIGEHRADLIRRRAALGEYGDAGERPAHADLGAAEAGGRRRHVRPNGSVLDVRYAPLPDGGTVVVVTDITALQQAEAEARERAALLQVMLDNMRHGIAFFDREHRLVTANELAARLCGLTPRQMAPGRRFEDLVADQAAAGEVPADRAERMIRLVREGTRAGPQRYQRQRPDGTVLEVISDPTPDGGFVVTYSDVTARARAEEEARERAELLQTTIDNLRQGIIVYGPDRRVRITNRLAGELAGHRAGAILPGRSLEEIIRDLIPAGALAPGPEAEAIVQRALTYDRSQPMTTVRGTRDGRVIEIHSDPLPDGGFIVSHIDITPLAKAEAEARARAAMLQAMLDNMRHGIALYGPDRRLRLANALAASLSGLTAEDFAPGTALDALVDRQCAVGVFGTGPDATEHAARLKALDRSRHHSGIRRLPDGRVVESSNDPTPDGGFVVTWSDITARAEAEEAARRRAAQLQGTLDGVRHGIALYGPDHRLVLANRLARPDQGLPQLEERVGMPFATLVREQKLLGLFGEGEQAERICEEVLARDRTQSHHYQRRLPNGRVMEVRSDPTPDGGFVITHSDVTELVQAQAEASERATLLQLMQDSMRHGIALYDREHRLVAANRLAARLTGLEDMAAMRGRTIRELMQRQVAMGEVAPDYAATHSVIDRGVPSRVMRERPDGTVLEITSDPTPDGGFVLTYTDVTALTRLEAESRHRADVLQAMLDNMRHGIVLYGPDRRVIAANALAAELGGHPPGTLRPGRTLDELVGEQVEGGELNRRVGDMALRMDRARPHRYVRPRPEGGFVEITSDPTPDGGFVVTMSDITALAEAEAEAKRQAAMQQVMLDNIRHGILLVDAAGKVVTANRVFCQLLGMPDTEVAPGEPFTRFVEWLAAHGEYGEGAEGAAVAAMIRDRDRNQPIRSVRTRPDGTVLEAVSDPTPDGGWVLTFTDITPARRAQEELERARDAAEAANRAKSRFLATMSHELRTPLNAVIGFSEALMVMPPGQGDPNYLRAIHDAGRHLLSLIDDILDVTRAETTGFAVSEAVVDLATVCEDAVRVMGSTASSGQVTLTAEIMPGLPKLRADELRLRQVLLNLLSNAVKFTAPGGTVRLSARRDAASGGVTVRITDTGIGMAPEEIPRAFEPFTQLDNALARRFQGSGLGLYLSKALAAAQGAELTLDSRPGEGTTALLHFPTERLTKG